MARTANVFARVEPGVKAFILPHTGGGEKVLGAVKSFAGIAMLICRMSELWDNSEEI